MLYSHVLLKFTTFPLLFHSASPLMCILILLFSTSFGFGVPSSHSLQVAQNLTYKCGKYIRALYNFCVGIDEASVGDIHLLCLFI